MARGGDGRAWASLLAGLASAAILPVAIWLTRFSERYELLHAGFGIPIAALLGLAAVALARAAQRRDALSLAEAQGGGYARAGRILGILGICMALAGLVSLGVYGLLEYVGSRD